MTSGTYQQIKNNLIQQAKDKYTDIFPVTNKASIYDDECFTMTDLNGVIRIHFWFNTGDNSTHIMQKVINN